MKNIYDALRLALIAAVDKYRWVRHLQSGKNPDVFPF